MKTLLFLIAITISFVSNAQDLLWKANFTGVNHNYVGKSAIDSENNIYALGYYLGTCTSVVPNFTTRGSEDIFLVKYNPNGVLLWARTLGSNISDIGTGIALSKDGSFVYITGIFQNTMYAENLQIISTGLADAFIAKYKSNGDIVWLKNVGKATGATTQRPNEINIDKNNNIIIGGTFESDITIGTEVKDTTFTTVAAQGSFIAILDTAANLIRAKKYEFTSTSSRLYTFANDTSGIYITGFFNGNLVTDLGTFVSNNASLDMYVYKLDYNLQSKWLLKVAGTANDHIYSCSVDNNGYFYVGGHFASNILVVDSLPNGTLSKKTGVNKTTNGKTDIFFAKYKHDGTLQWFNTAGSIENDYLYRANFQNGYFIAAGRYGESLTFRNKTITPLNTADAFAIIHTANNNLVGLIPVSGLSGNEVGETALVDNQNNAIVIGDYTSSKIFFTPTDSLVNSNSGTRDMFVAKYKLNLLNIPQTVQVENPYLFKSAVTVDSTLTADSIITQKLRTSLIKFNDGTSMNTAATGGSTVYASDGVYKDGDTVKLGGSTRGIYTEITTSDNALTGIAFNYEDRDNITFFASKNIPHGFQHTLKFDTTGLYFTSIDTTLTSPTHLMTEAQVKREIAAATFTPTNGLLEWDNVNKRYGAYGSKQASMSFYTGTTAPTLSTRLNLDGYLYTSGLECYSGGNRFTTINGNIRGLCSNSGGSGLAGHGAVSGANGVFGENTGYGNGVVGSSGHGYAGYFYNGTGDSNEGIVLRLERNRSTLDNFNVTGDLISIVDNPNSTGTISGKVISATIGTTERISLNPRATGSTTPYVFQTHNKPTGNLFEFGMQGRNKVYADTAGHITFAAIGAEIYRHEDLGDTTQNIPTGSTPTKITAFTTNGQSSFCTADKANNRLIITKTGWYDAELSISYKSGTANVEWSAYLYGNDTKIPSVRSKGKAITAGDVRSTQTGGRFYVSSVPYYVDYRVKHDNGGTVDLTFSCLNLRVDYKGY